MPNSSIWPLHKTLSGTTLGQSGPESDGNERVLHIPQSSIVTGASPSDCKSHIQDTRWVSHVPLQNCSRCILQPQPTGLRWVSVISWALLGGVLPLCRDTVGVFCSPFQPTGLIRSWRVYQDFILDLGHNTKKSPGELRRFQWKTCKK